MQCHSFLTFFFFLKRRFLEIYHSGVRDCVGWPGMPRVLPVQELQAHTAILSLPPSLPPSIPPSLRAPAPPRPHSRGLPGSGARVVLPAVRLALRPLGGPSSSRLPAGRGSGRQASASRRSPRPPATLPVERRSLDVPASSLSRPPRPGRLASPAVPAADRGGEPGRGWTAKALVRWRPCRRFHLAWPVGRVSLLRHGCGGRRCRPPFCGICWENLGPIRTETVGMRNLARNGPDRALP